MFKNWPLVSSVKNLTPASQETNHSTDRFNAGEELLDYWQIQWEAIHLAQDQVLEPNQGPMLRF
jgi:hypothetical protein